VSHAWKPNNNQSLHNGQPTLSRRINKGLARGARGAIFRKPPPPPSGGAMDGAMMVRAPSYLASHLIARNRKRNRNRNLCLKRQSGHIPIRSKVLRA
jgi:hypothetical protein